MQYIWNAISWFRCSTTVPVNPGDAPAEPPKESKTLSGWTAWASSTKSKADKVVEEVKDVAKAVENTVDDIKDAAKEVVDVVDAVKSGDIAAIKKEVTEAVTTVSEVKTSLETVVEETKEAVEEAKEVVEDVKEKIEETKELIDDSKKKETEKKEDGEKELGDDFVPHN